jgi:hypothetical protein
MRWKTYDRFDARAEAHEHAADVLMAWRCRKWLFPGETTEEFVKRICD